MNILFALITIITTAEIVWGAALRTQSATTSVGAQPGAVGGIRQGASGGVGDDTDIGIRGGDIGLGSVVGVTANGGGHVAGVGGQGTGLGMEISGAVSKSAGFRGRMSRVVDSAAGRGGESVRGAGGKGAGPGTLAGWSKNAGNVPAGNNVGLAAGGSRGHGVGLGVGRTGRVSKNAGSVSKGVGNDLGLSGNEGGQVADSTGGQGIGLGARMSGGVSKSADFREVVGLAAVGTRGQGVGLRVGKSGGVSKSTGSIGGGMGNVTGLAASKPIGQDAGGLLGGGAGRGGTRSRHTNHGWVPDGVLNPSIHGTQRAVSNGRFGTNRGGVGQREGDRGGLPTSYGGVGRGAGKISQGIGDGVGGGPSGLASKSTRSCGGLSKNGSAVGTSGDVLENTHSGSFSGVVGGAGLLRAAKTRKRKPLPTGAPPAKHPKASCPTSGFSYSEVVGSNGCICNFAGACDMKTNTPTLDAKKFPFTLDGFAPTNVESVALEGPSVGTICESDTVAILYDCYAHVPLYSATVIKGGSAGGVKLKRDITWRKTTDPKLKKKFIGGTNDYKGSDCQIYCYKDKTTGNLLNWDDSAQCKGVRVSIDRGHMIAARYGQGHSRGNGVKGTFTYTNVVPQISTFNRGAWSEGEKGMIKFAQNCERRATVKSKNKLHANIFVVVGMIPASFLDKPRFFGADGFSNYQADSKKGPGTGYKISYPEIMWTAGCCIYTDGTVDGTRAFWRRNYTPTKQEVKIHKTASAMFADITSTIANVWQVTYHAPTVFPNKPKCN